MKKIHKYEIPASGRFTLELPNDHEILCVQVQRSRPCLWVLIDTEEETSEVPFRVYQTGKEVENYVTKEEYIGTFVISAGTFVGHLFKDTSDIL